MPLVRATVGNEYGLGMAELYKDNEDPKALLDGVAVAGLVGILRQLGDLAEFAAEVFHGLQEQVMNTSSRSHKLMVRAQKIEAAVSPLEKTLLAQRSHLHFAYTTGSHWHAHIQSERNHFIYSDLPLFIMDSYEECRGPPRLHLLDKFDTGGPGSCLKRYSDPTFFKRASVGYDEAYAEKFTRDKKARRRKKVKQKRRTWIQNVDGPPHVNHPTSSHSGRINYASQNFEGETSSQTFSTYNAASKLEMGNHSGSFDSKTVSGYGECVFSPSYTSKFDGREPEEISSMLTMKHNDTVDTSSLYEESRAVADGIQEQTGARSSGVSWDEKIEIMEPTGPHYHSEETLDVPANFDPEPLEREATTFKSDYCSNDSTPKSVPCANQLDDIDSETDNYMDALNTIESESETDLECQTKQELEHFSSLNMMAMNESINRLNPQHIDSTSSNVDSYVPSHLLPDVSRSDDNHYSIPLESDCFSREKTSIAKPSSATSGCFVKVQSPCDTGKSSFLDSFPSNDLIEGDDIIRPNTETVFRNLSSSDSTEAITALEGDMLSSSPLKSQKSPSVPSGVTGINFWTNGGLLGLQPSKPPDFSALDSVHDGPIVPSSQSDILDSEENALETNIFQKLKISKQDRSAKSTTSFHNDQEDSISIMKTSLRSSQPHSNSIHERTSNFHHSFSSDQSHNLFSETSAVVLGTKKQDNLEVEAARSLESSSRIFELGNNLFANGQGKASSFSDDNRLSSSTTGISEKKSAYQAFQNFSGRTFLEQFGSGSPFISPSSSPPLEHMKISFQPVDGFDISKLKLKFPDGSECHESSRDVFPSFQLVPEESISLQDVRSDSDDDTFCESSPHGSDDCLSHSELDSEEWETRESSRCNDPAIYDALCENSTESVSSNLDSERIADGLITNTRGLQNLFNETVMEHTEADLPSFDILNNSFRKDLHNDFETKSEVDSEFSKDPTPPPPLPPVEWRGMKPNPDMSIEKDVPSFQGLTHEFYKKLSTSTISQQPKPAPVNQDNIEAVARATNGKHPDGQKNNVRKPANRSLNSKVVDEKEDFLQQIRTKSFSLRPTVTERPNLAASVPANVSVTAILEKANAIRQAVASDDDSWSEE